mmetsp:Transcript_104464/g.336888  ORF Transcript_104464/g.336888 Transcript_104464/m.336888 type:complete len:164 (+) Transcript_104464:81-572(+)
MGSMLRKPIPLETSKSMVDPKIQTFKSEPLDSRFDFDTCWLRLILTLKTAKFDWTDSIKVTRETDWEFTTVEVMNADPSKVLKCRNLVNPMENMVETRTSLAEAAAQHQEGAFLFVQWIVLHPAPLVIEGWRRSSHCLDESDLGFNARFYFEALFAALIALKV